MAGSGSGAIGAIGYAEETTPGTYVSPTRWLYPDTNGLLKDTDLITVKAMSGSRASTRARRTTLNKPAGSLGYNLFATHGAPLLKNLFGADTILPKKTDTVKTATPVATVNGVSTVTLTNTSGTNTYTQGAWFVLGTGLTAEARMIESISGNGAAGTILTMAAYNKQAAAAAGTACYQGLQFQFTTQPRVGVLPTFSLEDQYSSLFAYQYAGCLFDKMGFKGGASEIKCTADIFSTAAPIHLSSPTAPAPTAGEFADLKWPLSIRDSIVMAYGDLTALGSAAATYGGLAATVATAGVQNLTGVEDWSLDFQNGLIKKPTTNQSNAYRAWPGEQDCVGSYKYCNEALRSAEWDDFIQLVASQTSPFLAGAAINSSLTSTETFYGVGFYVPATEFLKATPIKVANDVIGETIEFGAVPATANGDYVQCFVMNADTGGSPY